MTFTWTAHRFAGGALALDVANSIVLRFDPERRIDRFADAAAIDSFAEAANHFAAENTRFGPLAPVAAENRAKLLWLREATDRHFRAEISANGRPELLADLLEAIAGVLRGSSHSGGLLPLDTATAQSALSLAANPEPDRLKICPNCGWLFLDRSRNRSRTWCDMAVCGNRNKARRHYHRNREETGP
ncbi:CGNR zinc finger domain-containing protein [Ensifer adhaerens]|uniref:CGNR zinc finger domain-containing protein n=1 Tax=Ensifer adhaerens TaxID=106592 RepID=UPI001CC086F7|nr:CGNR zinc finger domain-containing protein [Ensifer adhaerens]MBZ7921051.1 CGNR zinc finger domain-containing protein [Ensifer adhaerens]UAX93496.1 CGNR zinc finger domain-containing protein [Ensifer adhaerens]UAY01133.1 CGNR zinc finger domain-containing protein [Ensifer adhaerens]UAY08514.1 CGNR zinc finger domain-containing protein [Ensifer adhaerens]